MFPSSAAKPSKSQTNLFPSPTSSPSPQSPNIEQNTTNPKPRNQRTSFTFDSKTSTLKTTAFLKSTLTSTTSNSDDRIGSLSRFLEERKIDKVFNKLKLVRQKSSVDAISSSGVVRRATVRSPLFASKRKTTFVSPMSSPNFKPRRTINTSQQKRTSTLRNYLNNAQTNTATTTTTTTTQPKLTPDTILPLGMLGTRKISPFGDTGHAFNVFDTEEERKVYRSKRRISKVKRKVAEKGFEADSYVLSLKRFEGGDDDGMDGDGKEEDEEDEENTRATSTYSDSEEEEEDDFITNDYNNDYNPTPESINSPFPLSNSSTYSPKLIIPLNLSKSGGKQAQPHRTSMVPPALLLDNARAKNLIRYQKLADINHSNPIDVHVRGRGMSFVENLASKLEDLGVSPKYSFPFAAVNGSCYDIRSETSSNNGGEGERELMTMMNDDELPEQEDFERPGSRPLSAYSERTSPHPNPEGIKLRGSAKKMQRDVDVTSAQIRSPVSFKLTLDSDEEDSELSDDNDDDDDTTSTSHSKAQATSSLRRTRNPSKMFSKKEMETYFGGRARSDFFSIFKSLSSLSLTIPDRSLLAHQGRSPRSEFVAGIVKEGLTPWPILMRSLNQPRVVDLNGMGLGDRVITALTKVLDKLPSTDTLKLADNRLTDSSLFDLCEKVTHMPSLTSLDISFNDMDASSKTILTYLATPSCTLRKLYMEHSDIDDFECCDLMSALKSNTTLTKLDLRDNLIGAKEQLNVVMPELLTGGEAIAEMFKVNRTLTYLDVGWNSIRGDSALQMAECLEHNHTIKTLMLANNAFGDVPSQYLGDTLARNKGITHLDLSYNGVSPSAAMVIANSFKTNTTLDLLVLNGNTIGKRGAESLMQALRRSDRTTANKANNTNSNTGNLVIEINNCDCEFEDHALFDPVEPTNMYTLNMELPYSRMVMAELVRMANTRPGAIFKSIQYMESESGRASKSKRSLNVQQGSSLLSDVNVGSKKNEGVNLNLSRWQKSIHGIIDDLKDGKIDFPDVLNKDIRTLLGCMKLYPSIDTVTSIIQSLASALASTLALATVVSVLSEESILDTIFRSVFRIVDIDESKEVDRKEMKYAMSLMGVHLDDKAISRIIAEYDYDKSGTIEEGEFVAWMITKYASKKEPIKTLVKIDGVLYKPHASIYRKGVLIVDFIAERMPPTVGEVGSDDGVRRLILNIKHAETESEKVKLFEKATANSDIFMTSGQAAELMACGVCSRGRSREVYTVQRLLPQIVNWQECVQLVFEKLSVLEIMMLKKKLGPAFGVLLGNATGRYMLDLENDNHRTACRKLAELNNYEKDFGRCRSERGDTSQKGNWENFRNENVNQSKVKLDSGWFTKVPRFGKLRFDYVSTTRPSKAAQPLSSKRFTALLKTLKVDQLTYLREWYDDWSDLEAHNEDEERRRRLRVNAANMGDDDDGGFGFGFDDNEGGNGASVGAGGPSSKVKTLYSKNLSASASSKQIQTQSIDVTPKNKQTGNGNGKQRKTAKGMTSTPAIDAMVRSAKLGFFDTNANANADDGINVGVDGNSNSVDNVETGEARNQKRRGGFDATAGKVVMANGVKSRVKSEKDGMVDGGEGDGSSSDEEEDEEEEDDDGNKKPKLKLYPKFKPPFQIPTFITLIDATSHWRDYKDSTHSTYFHYNNETAKDKVKADENHRMQTSKIAAEKSRYLIPSPAYRHLYYKLMELQVAVISTAMTCKQCACVIECYPRQEFARVQAIVSTHRCLLDLENFHVVLRALDDSETREVFHRLGYLNVLNPMNPNRFYHLDLRFRDHRIVVEALSILAIEEPGDNWLHEEYRWSSFDDPVPGWCLPKNWTGRPEDVDVAGNGGCREFGRLEVEYTSEANLGCKPVWGVRKELRKRFLCDSKKVY